jgi:hypothetical protein
MLEVGMRKRMEPLPSCFYYSGVVKCAASSPTPRYSERSLIYISVRGGSLKEEKE